MIRFLAGLALVMLMAFASWLLIYVSRPAPATTSTSADRTVTVPVPDGRSVSLTYPASDAVASTPAVPSPTFGSAPSPALQALSGRSIKPTALQLALEQAGGILADDAPPILRFAVAHPDLRWERVETIGADPENSDMLVLVGPADEELIAMDLGDGTWSLHYASVVLPGAPMPGDEGWVDPAEAWFSKPR